MLITSIVCLFQLWKSRLYLCICIYCVFCTNVRIQIIMTISHFYVDNFPRVQPWELRRQPNAFMLHSDHTIEALLALFPTTKLHGFPLMAMNESLSRKKNKKNCITTYLNPQKFIGVYNFSRWKQPLLTLRTKLPEWLETSAPQKSKGRKPSRAENLGEKNASRRYSLISWMELAWKPLAFFKQCSGAESIRLRKGTFWNSKLKVELEWFLFSFQDDFQVVRLFVVSGTVNCHAWLESIDIHHCKFSEI